MMGGPLVVMLDVDGCLSPLTDTPRTTAHLYPGTGPLSVPYDPDLVGELIQLNSIHSIELRWLTTWTPHELDAWLAIGLGPFPHVQQPLEDSPHWKSVALAHTMAAEPHRVFVWIDDELSGLSAQHIDHSRLLTVQPDPAIGLTHEHLERIDQWSRSARPTGPGDL